MIDKSIHRFWGKAVADRFHPAVCHMVDTGLVIRELFAVQPDHFKARFAEEFGISDNDIHDLVAFTGALHDIGKISPGFQSKREDLFRPLRLEGLQFSGADEGWHGHVALHILPDLLVGTLHCGHDLALGLSRVLAAHHGAFLGGEGRRSGSGEWNESREATVSFLADCFWDKDFDGLKTPSTPALMLLAGLISVGDWLASAEEFFPYLNGPPLDLEGYLRDRTVRAGDVVRGLRFQITQPSAKDFQDLFDFASPNPCQGATLRVVEALRPPMFIVVESPMGGGKTEAAQVAYARLASHTRLRGMYYALPTQATGNAMLPRMEHFLQKLGLEDGAELHLLHGNADLNPRYERLRVASIDAKQRDVVASGWFSARKRGLLAGYGVGTIDQALLAALKVRHFFVRLFGLSGKFLILDEVHAYDTYMVEESTV